MRHRILILMGAVVLTVGCAGLDGVVGDVAGRAIGTAVEQRFTDMYAGYTDAMLFQLAYTQVFFLGGWGFGTDDFAEGEGATWRIESREADDTSVVTAERALLQRLDTGDSWWYLVYTPEDGEQLEYEILIDREMAAREMYMRDPETGEVRHHVFDRDDEDWEEDEALQEEGYSTETVYVDEWEQYRQERVTVSVGAGTYEADLLVHSITDEETGETVEYRWWVTPDVPGDLVQYEFEHLQDGSILHGEMIEIRQNYTFRLRD